MDSKYNKFIGQTIGVVTVGVAPRSYQGIDDKDPVYLELLSEASKDGLIIRTWLPTTVGTMDYRTDRLNVRINENGLIERLSIG